MSTSSTANLDVHLGNDVLSFQAHPGRWCKCYLRAQGEDRFLGAEAYDVLISRLDRVFDNASTSTVGILDGVPVRWILSLSEGHHTLYATLPNNEQVHLFWQDPQAVVAHRMLSTAHQWRELLQQLRSWLPLPS